MLVEKLLDWIGNDKQSLNLFVKANTFFHPCFSSEGVLALLGVYQVYHDPFIPQTMPHLYKSHQPAVTYACERLITTPSFSLLLAGTGMSFRKVWNWTISFLSVPSRSLFFLARMQLFLSKKKKKLPVLLNCSVKFLLPFSPQLSLLFCLLCVFPGCQNLFIKDLSDIMQTPCRARGQKNK